MGKIVLSCGHEVDYFGNAYNVLTKSTDRCGCKAVAYSTVCGPCEDRYRQAGELFESGELANEWLLKEEW